MFKDSLLKIRVSGAQDCFKCTIGASLYYCFLIASTYIALAFAYSLSQIFRYC